MEIRDAPNIFDVPTEWPENPTSPDAIKREARLLAERILGVIAEAQGLGKIDATEAAELRAKFSERRVEGLDRLQALGRFRLDVDAANRKLSAPPPRDRFGRMIS